MDFFKKEKKPEAVSGGDFTKPPEIPMGPPSFADVEYKGAPITVPGRALPEIPAAPGAAPGFGALDEPPAAPGAPAPEGGGMGFSSAVTFGVPSPAPAPAAEAMKPEAPFPAPPKAPEPSEAEETEGTPEGPEGAPEELIDEEFMPKGDMKPLFGTRGEKEVFEKGVITIKDPELLRAFAEIVSNRAAVDVIEALIKRELSVAEITDMVQMGENEARSIVQRLHGLGMLKATWYQTKDGKHFNKYKFTETKGRVDFDLQDLKETLSIEELEAKSTKLVALVTAEGKVPKSLVMSALGLNKAILLEQIVRYAETFKLPDVGDMITGDAPTSEEPDTLKKKESQRESEKLYSELEELESYLSKIK